MILVAKEVKKVTVWRVRLPSEYQEVEYIQSTGTQYLVIGNSFSTDYKVEIDVQLTATGGDQLLFGCTTNYRFGINAYSSYFKTITGGNSWSNTKSEDANRHTFIMDKGTTYVDGTPYSSSYVSYTYNFGLGLFDYNRIDGGTRFPAKEKLFSCKIYNGNTILHDLVPCYRKSDNVIGMYDLVNSQFYTNAGTGTFTKGNDVWGLEEKQVRPTGWQPGANTLLYLPLENDFVDQSGQATTRTFTTSGLSYTTVGGVPSVHIGSSGGAKLTAPYPIQSDREKPLTVSLLVYVTTQSSSSRRLILDMAATNGSWLWMALYENTSNVRVSFNNGDTTQAAIIGAIPSANSRFNIVATATAQSSKLYINGQLVGTGNGCQYPRGFRPYSHDNSQGIFCTRDVNRYTQALNGNARELIMEQSEWTAQEVASYYSQIKAKLGI